MALDERRGSGAALWIHGRAAFAREARSLLCRHEGALRQPTNNSVWVRQTIPVTHKTVYIVFLAIRSDGLLHFAPTQ